MYNKVLVDNDRIALAPTTAHMQSMWPELFRRKIPDSMVQFAFAYTIARDLFENVSCPFTLSAGAYEDIVTECLKLDGYAIVDVDPHINCDLHTFAQRMPAHIFDLVISASVLEHVENDEEFLNDCCTLLRPEGYGVFTMDFKDDWRPGQRVPYTSRRFYTTEDLTRRLPAVLAQHNCRVVGEQDYSARDTFIYDGINYSFASFIFKKD